MDGFAFDDAPVSVPTRSDAASRVRPSGSLTAPDDALDEWGVVSVAEAVSLPVDALDKVLDDVVPSAVVPDNFDPVDVDSAEAASPVLPLALVDGRVLSLRSRVPAEFALPSRSVVRSDACPFDAWVAGVNAERDDAGRVDAVGVEAEAVDPEGEAVAAAPAASPAAPSPAAIPPARSLISAPRSDST